MQENLLTLISYLASGLIVLEIVIIFYLHRLLGKGKDSKVISDKHYLELNLKIQYLKTLIILGSVVIVFLGWNVKSQVAEEVKYDIESIADKQIENINRKTAILDESINQLENRRNEIQREIETLNAENEKLKAKHKELNDEISKRIKDIETLLSIYIVTDVPFQYKEKPDTVYYKDLPSPINAKKLPDFKEPPIVNIQSTSDLGIVIYKKTKDYMIIGFGAIGYKFEGTLTFWIVER